MKFKISFLLTSKSDKVFILLLFFSIILSKLEYVSMKELIISISSSDNLSSDFFKTEHNSNLFLFNLIISFFFSSEIISTLEISS